MKTFFKIFFLLLIIIIGIPIGAGFLALQSSVEAPAYFDDLENTEAENTDFEEVMQTMVMSSIIGGKNIILGEEMISKMVYEQFNGYEKLGTKISGINTTVQLSKMWVTFDNDVFTLNGIIDYNKSQTSFTAKMRFEDTDDQTVITFDSFKMGKLPLPKFLFSTVLSFLEGRDMVNINYKYGDYDLDDMEITVDDYYINKLLIDQLGTDMIQFNGLNLDNQNITLTYDFVGDEGEAINALINELNNLLGNSDTFKSSFSTNLTGKTTLTEEEVENISSSVKGVLDTLYGMQSSTTSGDALKFTDEGQASIDLMMAQIDAIEDPVEKEKVSAVLIDTLIDSMDTENKEAIATYLNVTTDQLDDPNYELDSSALNDIMSQFLGG